MATAVFAFMLAWGEYLFAVTLITTQSYQPISVAVYATMQPFALRRSWHADGYFCHLSRASSNLLLRGPEVDSRIRPEQAGASPRSSGQSASYCGGKSVMRRFGTVPEVETWQTRRIQGVAPPCLARIQHQATQCGIRNQTIYHRDGYLFRYFEYVGDDWRRM